MNGGSSKFTRITPVEFSRPSGPARRRCVVVEQQRWSHGRSRRRSRGHPTARAPDRRRVSSRDPTGSCRPRRRGTRPGAAGPVAAGHRGGGRRLSPPRRLRRPENTSGVRTQGRHTLSTDLHRSERRRRCTNGSACGQLVHPQSLKLYLNLYPCRSRTVRVQISSCPQVRCRLLTTWGQKLSTGVWKSVERQATGPNGV